MNTMAPECASSPVPVTRPANEVLLLSSGDVPDRLLADLERTHPWITVPEVGEDIGYYETKNVGAELVTGDVVVFADADCRYDAGWLRALLMPFASTWEGVVSGEVYLAKSDWYGMAMALMYVFDPPSH